MVTMNNQVARKKRILFYCQHVLGMGHLIRSLEIVRGLTDFEVCFLNGGVPVRELAFPVGVRVVDLPPLQADGEFGSIYSVDSSSELSRLKEARTSRLLEEFDHFLPDIVVIELFPFGRKQFAFELIPLLEHAQQASFRPKVVCSLRDILVKKRDQAGYEERVVTLMNRYFDALLVHSDPQFQRLEETFSRAKDLTCHVTYTGFVAQAQPEDVCDPVEWLGPDKAHLPLIVVSIGGGRVGVELVEASVKASVILADSVPHRVVVFTGPYMPDEQFRTIEELVRLHAHIVLRRFTTCFLAHLKRADLSISMAGYNTCMNLLTTGVRALVLPFSGGGDSEQTLRAQKLARAGVVTVIEPHELAPDLLARKIARSLDSTRAGMRLALNVDGVQRTAACLQELADGRFRDNGRHRHEPSESDQMGSNEPGWVAELRREMSALEGSRKEVCVFFRNDDVDEDEASLRRLIELFQSADVPVSLAVIPGLLTNSCTALLRSAMLESPGLIELTQHGWKHLNHEREGRKCEFGTSRTVHEQFDDISKGQAVLKAAFHGDVCPTFVPPWNRCNADTYQALNELGFLILSKDRGKEPVTGHRFQEISVTIDLHDWKHGATTRDPEAIVAELVPQMTGGRPVGIMLHHKVMDTATFEFVDRLMAELRRCSVVRFHTLRSLVQTQELAAQSLGR